MSKRIPLTQGQFAIVDDEDYEAINKYKWYAAWAKNTNSFYAFRTRLKSEPAGTKNIRMHRVITMASDGLVVDHINHETLDNRKANLRLCTNSQNSMNRGKQSNNTSGYKGVSWCRSINKWQSRIAVNKKIINLGSFSCPYMASLSYNEAAKKYHSSFAFKKLLD